jgi:antirestriction protein ArdC
MNVYEIVTEQIIKKLESGVIPWKRPWIGGSAKNLISGKNYQGINTMLLACSGFSNPYWLTFKQAKAKGGHVKKGEQSTIICFWKTYNKSAPTDSNPDNEDRRFVLRYYRVFNVEQCEGIETPDIEKREFTPIEQCENVIDSMPNKPSIVNESNQACYFPSHDKVNMPAPESFESEPFYYSVLFHELSHSTGHKSRLDRHSQEKTDHLFGSKDYSKEELVAEMGAAFLCGHCEIDNEETVDNSAAYIQSWVKKFKEQPKMVVSAAGKAQKAANYILNK